jgi:hypothetical protein
MSSTDLGNGYAEHELVKLFPVPKHNVVDAYGGMEVKLHTF